MIVCEWCGKSSSPPHGKRFCNKSCANKFVAANQTLFVVTKHNYKYCLDGEKINKKIARNWMAPNHQWCTTLREVIVCIEKKFTGPPKCERKSCGNYVSFYGQKHSRFCSIKCRNKTIKNPFVDPNDNYNMYKKRVQSVSHVQPIHLLDNFEKRGKIHKNDCDCKNIYHLDHKFSIKFAFDKNILPVYVGNINNLTFLPALHNIKKSNKCSISEEELFETFHKERK